MFRKSVVTTLTLILIMAIGVTGVGASGKIQGAPTVPAQVGKQDGAQRNPNQSTSGQASPLTAVGTGFTYQGRLTNGGAVANGQYDLIFTLWDASSSGAQVGSQVAINSQTITDGLFTVTLDFGTSAFTGEARWLQIQVRPAGNGSYTTLSPRQPLTPAPYAMSLMPGAVVAGTSSGPLLTLTNSGSGYGVKGQSTSGIGVWGTSDGNPGVYGSSNSGMGLYGLSALNDGIYATTGGSSTYAGVHGTSSNSSGNGVIGEANNGTSANGVWGNSTSGTGVRGTGGSGTGGYFSGGNYGVYASTGNSNNAAVYGTNSSDTGIGVQGVVSNTAVINAAGVLGQNNGAGAGVEGISVNGAGVWAEAHSTNEAAVEARNFSTYGTAINGWGGTNGTGVSGDSMNGHGVFGYSGNSYGVYGASSGATNEGRGVYGRADNGYGVYGDSLSGTGVYGYSSTWYGVYGSSANSTGVVGSSSTWYGVYGASTNSTGVVGNSTNGNGGSFNSSGGTGALGSSTNGTGVYGTSASTSSAVAGLYGVSTGANGNGVIGQANNGTSAYGVWGKSTTGYAGFFSGNVHVNGTLSKSAGSFKIDDPIDPANKYLSHSFVESPDMMNIYNGNVTTNAKGEATVTMPAWFQALNQDFRYQLTVIGQFSQAIVASEMKDNHFAIKTDKPNVKVSWLVTGIRHDAYAEAHRIPVEEAKPSNEKGYYLHPELYGQSDSKAMENSRPNAQATPSGSSTNK